MRKSVSPHKAPIRVVIKDNLGADAPGASAPRACARTNPPQLILYDNIYAIDHRYFSRR
jgi:hypothetical protein